MISGCIWNSGFIMSEDLLPGGEIKTLSWQNNNECDHQIITQQLWSFVMFHRVQMKGDVFTKPLKFKLDFEG